MPEQVDAVSRHHSPKMSEMVAADLRTRILRGDLKPGDSLASEAALMEDHGVSRPTLREALRLLEAEQLISVRRGSHRGPVVRLPDTQVTARAFAMLLQLRHATLADIYRFRMIFEPGAARLVAETATDVEIATLRTTLEEESQALDDWAAFTFVSWRFHSELIALSRNVTMSVVAETLQHVSGRYAFEALAGSPDRVQAGERSMKAHHRLVDLIAARRGAEAERFWQRHMTAAGEMLMARADKISIVELLR
jgi:DNA-binding FadR family transcriptional regulator